MNYREFLSFQKNYNGPQYLQPLPRRPSYLPDRRLKDASIVASFSPLGVSKHQAALKHWDANMRRAAERGVKKAIDFLLKETLKVTPQETGNLRAAGHAVMRDRGPEVQGIVFFDEVQAPYAIYVHEDLTKYHKPPTMGKFLQRTQFKFRGKLSQIIREEIQKARP